MWSEPILHVDMDSFFVEVERLSDPGLRGLPVAVGGTGRRGVIASASYEAREYGVRSAQPTGTARRRCPHLVVVPPRHSLYSEISAEVFGIFRGFTPMVEGVSLDEAFLDVSSLRLHYGDPLEIGTSIRSTIREQLDLPASVGIAATKFVAKLASEAAKPDGLRHVPRSQQQEFLTPLPAQALWGVGPATLAGLARLGVTTVGEIAEIPEATLATALGGSLASHLQQLARGEDPREVEPDQAAKSISVEETYQQDLTGRETMETAVLAHSQRLAGRLRRSGLRARTVTVKLRYEDFETPTRAKTVDAPIAAQREIYAIARSLLGELDTDRPVRLIGLAASGLSPESAPAQLGLGEETGWEAVDDVVGDIRDRFGDSAVAPARLISDEDATREP